MQLFTDRVPKIQDDAEAERLVELNPTCNARGTATSPCPPTSSFRPTRKSSRTPAKSWRRSKAWSRSKAPSPIPRRRPQPLENRRPKEIRRPKIRVARTLRPTLIPIPPRSCRVRCADQTLPGRVAPVGAAYRGGAAVAISPPCQRQPTAGIAIQAWPAAEGVAGAHRCSRKPP